MHIHNDHIQHTPHYIARAVAEKPRLRGVYIHVITRYGSTLYIGIAMGFVFSPYIKKFSSCFHFQVISTFNDFISENQAVY